MSIHILNPVITWFNIIMNTIYHLVITRDRDFFSIYSFSIKLEKFKERKYFIHTAVFSDFS